MSQNAAFICDSIRTPIGRYAGALAAVRADDLATIPIRALFERNPAVDPAVVEDVLLGCANQAGEDNRNVARMAALLADLPESVPGTTLNRLCASGLDAVGTAARAIMLGETDLHIAGGVESMSRAPFVMGKAEKAFARQAEIYDTTIGWRFVNQKMHKHYGTDSMPETGENVAETHQVARADQDAFAVRSQQRTARAVERGRLAEEITPVSIPQRKGEPIVVERDEHPRADTTVEKLAKLPTPFRENGSVTAGNASGVNDGAAAMFVASETAAKTHGLEPVARVVSMATAGVEPRLMGIGPIPATQKVLAKTGLSMKDVGVIELNEAFASQSLAVLRALGVEDDAEHVNPNGGAIALGHPLGMSGARLALTLSREIKARGVRYGLATMCVGVGQGVAMVLEGV
jgi:3-oxoadipyl-CoA thiolase